MKTIDPQKSTIPEVHHLLLGGVAPRPIALVSTISSDGIPNLSPFSFFNAFGANPPTIAFSPSRRGRDGTTKDTLNNLKANNQCVVQVVSYELVQQVSLASTEYPPDIDEFVKSGLTPIPSDIVKPFRVKESPFQMECEVQQIVPLGEGKASGNLVICRVLLFHIDETLLDNGSIHPDKIRLVGRNSADYYTKAFNDSIFEISKPIGKKGLGFDNLPPTILDSSILTGNNLAQLANCESIPADQQLNQFKETVLKSVDTQTVDLQLINEAIQTDDKAKRVQLAEQAAKIALESRQDTTFAWCALLLVHRQ